jgi:phage regulator Rha-like protein
MNDIVIPINAEARVDTRVLAAEMDLQHPSVFLTVTSYQSDFEQLGVVRFQIGKPSAGSKGGRPERIALLNEDQCYLLLTYSRNTDRVRELKVKLIRAFREMRESSRLTEIEYLPGYHELHSTIHRLAAGSTNERFVHMNVNKAINKAVGIEPGQRNALDFPVKSLVTVAQMVANQAMAGAQDHHDGYQACKESLATLSKAISGLGKSPSRQIERAAPPNSAPGA